MEHFFQSGVMGNADTSSSSNAQFIFDAVANRTGCGKAKDKLQCLRHVDVDVFREAQDSLPSLISYSSFALSYISRYDGNHWPEWSFNQMMKKEFTDVPVILGVQEDEGSMFVLSLLNITTKGHYRDYLKYLFVKLDGHPDQLKELMDLYPINTDGETFGVPVSNSYPASSPAQRPLAALLGDTVFEFPHRYFHNLTQKHWSFRGATTPDLPILGSLHSGDFELMYHKSANFSSAGESYRRYFLSFVYHKDPNVDSRLDKWERYGENGNQLRIGFDDNRMIVDNSRLEQAKFVRDNFKLLVT